MSTSTTDSLIMDPYFAADPLNATVAASSPSDNLTSSYRWRVGPLCAGCSLLCWLLGVVLCLLPLVTPHLWFFFDPVDRWVAEMDVEVLEYATVLFLVGAAVGLVAVLRARWHGELPAWLGLAANVAFGLLMLGAG